MPGQTYITVAPSHWLELSHMTAPNHKDAGKQPSQVPQKEMDQVGIRSCQGAMSGGKWDSAFKTESWQPLGTDARERGKGNQMSGSIRKRKRQDFATVGDIRGANLFN